MTQLFALILSLMLLGSQVLVAAQPVSVTTPAKCACCKCKRAHCCVAPDASNTTSPARTAVLVAPFHPPLFCPAVSPAWVLPTGEADSLSAVAFAPSTSARVPLFARHCARLI